MKIGFDGKRAVQNFTGLGNYSRYLLNILGKYYPENEYDIFAPHKRENKQLDRLFKENSCFKMICPNTSFWRFFPSIWRIWGIKKQLKKSDIELFHGLSNELPLNIHKTNIRSIVTIHDLIFLRFPDCYPAIDRKIYTHKFRKACINADHIIAVSECTKKDIIHFFGIPEEKISVIYQGCDDSFAVTTSKEKKVQVRAKYHLPERYILNVGRIEKRKNALLAVKALSRLTDDIHLVIVGHRTKYSREIEQYISDNGLKSRVLILDNVSFEDLPAIYQQAELFIYPSIFEGFGIPVIEALSSGIPVIATADSCLEEAGGPSSIYIESNNDKALTEAIMQILYNPKVKEQMIRQGKEYVERFSEKTQAESLMKLYTDIRNRD